MILKWVIELGIIQERKKITYDHNLLWKGIFVYEFIWQGFSLVWVQMYILRTYKEIQWKKKLIEMIIKWMCDVLKPELFDKYRKLT